MFKIVQVLKIISVYVQYNYKLRKIYYKTFLFFTLYIIRSQNYILSSQEDSQEVTRSTNIIKMNASLNFSDEQILEYLNSRPGRLQSFLAIVPLNELRNAVQQKQIIQDVAFHNQRNTDGNAFKKNVLDFTLQQVIQANKNEKIIDYFQYLRAIDSARLQNHIQYGMRLVRNFPQKYYVGNRSTHFNHAREIQQIYGIRREQSSQNSNQNISQQNEISERVQQIDQNDQEEKKEKQEQNSQEDQEDQENFIVVEDSNVEFYQMDQIDILQQKLKKKRKEKKSSKKSTRKSGEKPKTNQLGKARKLRKLNKRQDQELQISQQIQKEQDYSDSAIYQEIKNKDHFQKVKNLNKSFQDIIGEQLNTLVFQEPSINTKKIVPFLKKKMVLQSQEDQ